MGIKYKKIWALLMTMCMMVTGVVSADLESHAEASGDAVIIDVTDYGADPTGIEDSAEAIQAAVEAAKQVEGDVVISFPEGEYDIYPDKAAQRELYISNTVGANQSYSNKKIGILLEDMENVTVDGNGSVFMFHGKMMTFAAINCENVLFTDFTVDFQVPTVIDLTVEKVQGNSAIVYVPGCYFYEISGTNVKWMSEDSPYTGEPYWTATNNCVYTQRYDTKTGLTWRGNTGYHPVFSNVASIEDMGNQRLKFTYHSLPSELREGLCFQSRPTVRDHAGSFFWKSKDVCLSNLDIQFLHGFGMVGQHSENLTLDDVDFECDMDSGRTTASYADFVQMSGCKGKVEIMNCTFSNPHDDPINIHGTFNKIVAMSSDRKQITVRYMHNETAGFPNYFEGDEIEFMTAGNMIPVENSVRTVVKVDGPDGQGGIMGQGSGNLTDIILTLDEPVPSSVAVNSHVVENITYTPEVSIHDNIFKETPTRGILVTTRKKIVIEDNYFDGMGMASIYISNDAQGWYESGPTKDVTIKNNVFTRGKGQAILVEPTNPTVSATSTVHENMLIENNIFFMENQRVLDAKSVGNLTFKNNKIYRQDAGVSIGLRADKTALKVGEEAVLTASAAGNRLTTKAYYFNGCDNVSISGNIYDDGMNAGISYTNMVTSDVTVSDDHAALGTDQNIPAVNKVYYKSSDDNVIRVSADGKVLAAGEGTAEVTAYAIAAGRSFEGGTVSFTVTAPASAVELPDAEENPVDDALASSADANTLLKTADIFVSGNENNKLFTYNQSVDFYLKEGVTDKFIDVKFEAENEAAAVEMYFNNQLVEGSEGRLELCSGRNLIEVLVTAENTADIARYRFLIHRTGDNNTALDTLSVDGNELPLEDGVYEYQYYISEPEEVTITAEAESDSSSVEVIYDKQFAEDGKVQIKDGSNYVYVRVLSETSSVSEVYTIMIKTPDRSNAALENVIFESGVKLDKDFAKDTLEYAGMLTKAEVGFTVKAEEPDASITVRRDGKKIGSGTGSCEAVLNAAEGMNNLVIKVVSADKTEEIEYKFMLDTNGFVYASDLEMEANSYVGYGEIMLDQADGGKKISLVADDQGTVQSFEKGIFAHATSEIYYNVKDQGYGLFEAYVGVDSSQGDKGGVTFYVYIDGKAVASTTELTGASKMVLISVEIPEDAEVIRLKADQGAVDYNDHAVWADAKFYSGLDDIPEEITEEVCEVFTDVLHGAWYESYVQYVYDNGLMAGNNGLFNPTKDVTRAQLVTTLYRLAQEPTVTDYSALEAFSDVAAGQYYTDPISWAYNVGVGTGNNGKFDVTGKLTRQQMAAFLFRFAGVMGYDTSAREDYSDMLNADQVSSYAEEAVSWAVGTGLISGSEKTDQDGNTVYDLNPRGNTTRAQLSAILQRFCEGNHL